MEVQSPERVPKPAITSEPNIANMTTLKFFKLVLLILGCTIVGLVVLLLRDEEEFVYFNVGNTQSCPLNIEKSMLLHDLPNEWGA